MPRKRRRRMKRRRSAPVARMFRRRARRKSGSSASKGINFKLGVFGFLYGFSRGTIDQFTSPILSKLPLGGVADEVGLMGLYWGLNKWVIKNPLGKDLLRTGFIVESASLGQAFGEGIPLTKQASSASLGGITIG